MTKLWSWLLGAIFALLFVPAFAAPLSTLQLPSTTTAYTAGQFMATSATGTAVIIPNFNLQSLNGQSIIVGGHISINDTTASSWNGQTVTINFYDFAPTFLVGSGDRSTYSPATGTVNYHKSLTCIFSAIAGDGVSGDCYVTYGNAIIFTNTAGQQIYWTAVATTGSGTTGASKVLSFTPEVIN